MSTFFGLLVFLCIVALVIGMIRPKLILRWGPEERRNRKTLAVVTIAGMILFTFLAAQRKKLRISKGKNRNAWGRHKKRLTIKQRKKRSNVPRQKRKKLKLRKQLPNKWPPLNNKRKI